MQDKQKYLTFIKAEQVPNKKTSFWFVQNARTSAKLGTVAWYSQWRRYVFSSTNGVHTIFDSKCLQEIADFLDEQTNIQKEGWKRR